MKLNLVCTAAIALILSAPLAHAGGTDFGNGSGDGGLFGGGASANPISAGCDVDCWIGRLASTDPLERTRAAQALAELQEDIQDEGGGPLTRALAPLSGVAEKDIEPGVRTAAVFALGLIAGHPATADAEKERIFPVLRAVLFLDPLERVREKAAAALGELRYAPAVEALLAVLQEPDSMVSANAQYALGYYPESQAAFDALTAAFTRAHNPGGKGNAVDVLSRHATPRAYAFLNEAMTRNEEDPVVRCGIARKLHRFRGFVDKDTLAEQALAVEQAGSEVSCRGDGGWSLAYGYGPLGSLKMLPLLKVARERAQGWQQEVLDIALLQILVENDDQHIPRALRVIRERGVQADWSYLAAFLLESLGHAKLELPGADRAEVIRFLRAELQVPGYQRNARRAMKALLTKLITRAE